MTVIPQVAAALTGQTTAGDPAPLPRIPLAGVIGHPIAHSRSPALHGYWLRELGIQGHYIPMDIAPADFEAALRMLPRLGFVGVNVTVPHKETVMSIADQISDRAAVIGAANTLSFRPDGKIFADNTDGYGFIANLRQYAPNWVPSSGPAAVLGAGGAARAVVSSLLEEGVPEVLVANRTRIRAENLHRDFGGRVVVWDWAQAGHMIAAATLVVNTTSLGMSGKPDLKVPLDGLWGGQTVCDLVYAPLQTDLLRTAAEVGCTCVDGLGMLLHQGVPGFERWFGQRPSVTDALRAAVLS